MIQYIKSHLLIDFHHNFRITFKLERKYTFLKIKYEPHVSEPNIHFVEHYLHLCAFKYLMKHPSMFAKLKCHSIGSIVYSLVLFFFFQLEANYFTLLQWFLPYIDMNHPWIYMCSPSQSPLPPPSPYDPSGSSQCTSPEHLSHASNLDL